MTYVPCSNVFWADALAPWHCNADQRASCQLYDKAATPFVKLKSDQVDPFVLGPSQMRQRSPKTRLAQLRDDEFPQR